MDNADSRGGCALWWSWCYIYKDIQVKGAERDKGLGTAKIIKILCTKRKTDILVVGGLLPEWKPFDSPRMENFGVCMRESDWIL